MSSLKYSIETDQYFMDYGYFSICYTFDEVEESYFYEIYVDGNFIGASHPTSNWTLDEAVASSAEAMNEFLQDAKELCKQFEELDMGEVQEASRIYKDKAHDGN